jgi:hypothetical protein
VIVRNGNRTRQRTGHHLAYAPLITQLVMLRLFLLRLFLLRLFLYCKNLKYCVDPNPNLALT